MSGKILSENEYFYLSSGQALTSISDFTRLLKSMNSDLFSEYVTSTKNDFYNWMLGAVGNVDLANAIKKANSPDAMLLAVKTYFGQVDAQKELPKSNYQVKHVEKVQQRKALKEHVKAMPSAINESTMDDDLLRIGESLANLKKSSETTNIGNTPVADIVNNDVVNKKKLTSKKSPKTKKLRTSKKTTAKKSKTAKKRVSVQNDVVEPKTISSSLSDIKQSLDSDFDFSLDLDNQRDTLSKIRERINSMDSELKGTSTLSFSQKKIDESYPNLAHETIPKKELHSKKKIMHAVKHHVVRHVKNAHEHAMYHVRTAHMKIKNAVAETKKKAEINRKVEAITRSEQKQISNRIPKSRSSLGFSVVNQSGNETPSTQNLEADSVIPEKTHFGFFHKLAEKMKHAEKVVAKDLPNLHEFAQERRAEERFNPYERIEHPKNYHNHGVPDFVRGLLIGILIGMIFLAIF